MTAFYPNSSMLGVDFNNAQATASYAAGTKALGSNDTVWVYCEFNGAATTGDCCTVTTAGTATRVVTSGGQDASQQLIVFPQTAVTSGYYAWCVQHGRGVYVAVSATCNPSAALYVATSSGKLSTTSASSTIAGVALMAVSGTATTAVTVANVVWPKWMLTTNGVG